mgnify:CR=1 FL=1
MTLLKAIFEEVTFTSSQISSLFRKKRPIIEDPSVILYHGYLSGVFYMNDIMNYLDSEGFPSFAENYHFLEDMRITTKKETEKIDRICQKKGEKVSLIGHSQGGLIATSIAQDNPELINKVIALGTPFYGTKAAYLQYPVISCKQMLSGSSYLQELREKGFPEEVDFHSIMTFYDHIVIPYDSARAPFIGKNIETELVDDCGHASLIKHHELIVDILKK